MGLNTRSLESQLRINYALKSHRDAIYASAARIILAAAIKYSPASIAIVAPTEEEFNEAFEYATPTCNYWKYQWMQVLGACLLERADHAFLLIPEAEQCFSGFGDYGYEYVREHVLKMEKDDHQYEFVKEDGEWQLRAGCNIEHLGCKWTSLTEIGYARVRGFSEVTADEALLYATIAKVYITQHNEKYKAAMQEPLDFSYNDEQKDVKI